MEITLSLLIILITIDSIIKTYFIIRIVLVLVMIVILLLELLVVLLAVLRVTMQFEFMLMIDKVPGRTLLLILTLLGKEELL